MGGEVVNVVAPVYHSAMQAIDETDGRLRGYDAFKTLLDHTDSSPVDTVNAVDRIEMRPWSVKVFLVRIPPPDKAVFLGFLFVDEASRIYLIHLRFSGSIPRSNTMPTPLNSDTVTHGIRVQVYPGYLPDHSDPGQSQYVFAYRIVITNDSERWVKLINRHWVIINADGKRSEVRGPGVVGLQPELEPGENHEYQSLCPLDTEWGTMEGEYEMQDADGRRFEVEIGRFYLAISSDEKVETWQKN